MVKKMLKLLSSRLFYVFLGLFLALSIFVVQAAWSDHVNSGQTLTAQAWNEIVDKLIELDGRVGNGNAHRAIVLTGTPIFSNTINPSGNGWTALTHRGSYETLPGQYICGIQHKQNCDDYSSEDACISIKVCTD